MLRQDPFRRYQVLKQDFFEDAILNKIFLKIPSLKTRFLENAKFKTTFRRGQV